MHTQFRKACITERSGWVQNEHHGSLIVNVITVSGKTAVWVAGSGGVGWWGVIEVVESKDLFVYSAPTASVKSELVTEV